VTNLSRPKVVVVETFSGQLELRVIEGGELVGRVTLTPREVHQLIRRLETLMTGQVAFKHPAGSL
jgi:hypothetical protein